MFSKLVWIKKEKPVRRFLRLKYYNEIILNFSSDYDTLIIVNQNMVESYN